MRERHVPMRLCLGCNQSDRQDRLERFALVDATLVRAPRRRKTGRSGYVHAADRCLERFSSRKPFLRSLRASVGRAERERLVAEIRESR